MEQIQPGESETNLTDAIRNSSKRYTSISWTTWIIDGMLLAAAIVGACYAWPIQGEAGQLHAKRLDLQRRVGEMRISDPTKYHVLLLKSENPLEFRWRIYIPAKTAAMLSTENRSTTGSGSGTSSLTSSVDPALECLVTATIFPVNGSSDMEIKTRTRSLNSRGTSNMSLRDEVIQRMVKANDTSSWSVAGKSGVEAFSVEQMVWLLKIEPPSQDSAVNKPGVIRIGLGTQSVINKVRAQ